MTLEVTEDVPTIRALLDAAIRADPVRHTVEGTIRGELDAPSAAPWCGYDGAALAARALPEQPVALTAGWPDPGALAERLAGLPTLTGLGGPVAAVDEVVARLPYPPAVDLAQRLYRLDELSEPARVAGRARPVAGHDLPLLADWLTAFVREAFGTLPVGHDPQQVAARYTPLAWLWQDAAGAPVALAARRPAVGGAARIGPVYTPPAERGHGYGTAVTAAATRSVLAEPAVPVLFTDLANGTSNRIYQSIGYRPLGDWRTIRY